MNIAGDKKHIYQLVFNVFIFQQLIIQQESLIIYMIKWNKIELGFKWQA